MLTSTKKTSQTNSIFSAMFPSPRPTLSIIRFMIRFLTELPSGKQDRRNTLFKKDVITAFSEPHAGPESSGKSLRALVRRLFTVSLGLGVFFSPKEPIRTSKMHIVSCWKENSAEQLRAKLFQCVQQKTKTF